MAFNQRRLSRNIFTLFLLSISYISAATVTENVLATDDVETDDVDKSESPSFIQKSPSNT